MNQRKQLENNTPSIQFITTENSAVAESLSDLPLPELQAEETKAGAIAGSGGGGAGKVSMQDFHFVMRNHG